MSPYADPNTTVVVVVVGVADVEVPGLFRNKNGVFGLLDPDV